MRLAAGLVDLTLAALAREATSAVPTRRRDAWDALALSAAFLPVADAPAFGFDRDAAYGADGTTVSLTADEGDGVALPLANVTAGDADGSEARRRIEERQWHIHQRIGALTHEPCA